MELSQVSTVVGTVFLVCFVLALLTSWKLKKDTKGKTAPVYNNAAYVLFLLVLIFVPISLLDGQIDSILNTIEDFVDYPREVETAYRSYDPDCSQLTGTDLSDCEFCKAESKASADLAADYQISGVDDLKTQVGPFGDTIYVLGAVVVGAGAAAWLLAWINDSRGGEWKSTSRCASGTVGCFLGAIGLALLSLGLLVYHLCDVYVSKDSLGSEARWFVDPSAENDASGRPWIADLATFDQRCTDAPDAVKRVNSPGALEEEYNNLDGALCTRVPDAFVFAGAVVLVSLVAWEIGLLFLYFEIDVWFAERFGNKFKSRVGKRVGLLNF